MKVWSVIGVMLNWGWDNVQSSYLKASLYYITFRILFRTFNLIFLYKLKRTLFLNVFLFFVCNNPVFFYFLDKMFVLNEIIREGSLQTGNKEEFFLMMPVPDAHFSKLMQRYGSRISALLLMGILAPSVPIFASPFILLNAQLFSA